MESTSSQPLRIDYESEGFPVGSPVSNGPAVLQTNWNELLWAALTVGRPNRQYVFRHGNASMYEAIFRLSLVRMALEQRGPYAYRLRRTNAAKTLDPTEKGAVNYFLGMAFCKLFCARVLNVWLLVHLDVFRPMLNIALAGRSRPDLVGQTVNGEWLAIESKGRISTPYAKAKNKAKEQAERVISIDDTAPTFHIGAISYFRNDVVRFFWRDPKPEIRKAKNPIVLPHDDSIWLHCYRPVLDLIEARSGPIDLMSQQPILLPVQEFDIEIGVHPLVIKVLSKEPWRDARRIINEHARELHDQGYQPDGVRIKAGRSWVMPFVEFEDQRKE